MQCVQSSPAQVWFHQAEIPREGNQRQIGIKVDPIVSTAQHPYPHLGTWEAADVDSLVISH